MSEIITHSTESGSVAADEDGVVGGSEHDVSSSNINDDLTCDETEKAKESQEDETNPTTSDIVDHDDAESADTVDDEPAAEEQRHAHGQSQHRDQRHRASGQRHCALVSDTF